MGTKKANNSYENRPLKLMATTPLQLLEDNEIKFQENHNFEEINYQEIILRDKRPFS